VTTISSCNEDCKRAVDALASPPNKEFLVTMKFLRRAQGGKRSSTVSKLILTIAVLGAAASISGLATFATFTSATSASHTISSGTVTIALGATGASTNRLNIGASGIAPGDTIQRSVDLSNSGSLDLASVTLTTSASPSSLLDTDGTNGLQMVIDKCSQAWTESGPPYTYTCSGTTSAVLASRAVIGSALALSNLGSTTAGATDHLRVTLTLPSGAGNTFRTSRRPSRTRSPAPSARRPTSNDSRPRWLGLSEERRPGGAPARMLSQHQQENPRPPREQFAVADLSVDSAHSPRVRHSSENDRAGL
jgi:spore coat-associated protein N